MAGLAMRRARAPMPMPPAPMPLGRPSPLFPWAAFRAPARASIAACFSGSSMLLWANSRLLRLLVAARHSLGQ